MIFKYIVTWVVSTTYPVACPDVQIDEFTGDVVGGTICLVNHVESESRIEEKTFYDREEAFKFLKQGEKRVEFYKDTWWMGSKVTSIKIDSVAVVNNPIEQ